MVHPISEPNAQLPGPEREVLALLADSGLGYARVGELMGVDARTGEIVLLVKSDALDGVDLDFATQMFESLTGVPSRIEAVNDERLRALLTGRVADCLEELPSLAAGIDGEALGPADREHPRDCPVCRENLDAMRAADAAYRAWMPGAMPDGLHDRIRTQVQGVLDGDDA